MCCTKLGTLFKQLHSVCQGSLSLSTQNVRTLLYAHRMTLMPLFPEFLQLLDDDIVSLTALTLIVNPQCRLIAFRYYCISQLTVAVSDDTVSVEATSPRDITGSDTRLH